MHEFISFKGEISLGPDVAIPAVSSAALHGKGIFTAVAINDGQPFLWEKHWRRLTKNAAKVGIDLSEHSEQTVRNSLDEIISQNGVTNGRARLTVFDESASSVWPIETDAKTSLLIITGDLRPTPKNFRLTVSPYTINSNSPLSGIKSCNYLENLLALDEAKDRGFDDAIRLNERGHITSSAMANVFWLRNDILYTPSLATGCLAGTTREFVLENLECEEVEASVDELKNANAIFLTSAGLGIVKADEMYGRRSKKMMHPITQLI